MKQKRWTCRFKKKTYSVIANDLREATKLLVNLYRIDLRKLESLEEEEIEEQKPKTEETTYIVTVGKQDYYIPASDKLGAILALGERGVDVSKASNVRKEGA